MKKYQLLDPDYVILAEADDIDGLFDAVSEECRPEPFRVLEYIGDITSTVQYKPLKSGD
jgi:hypothetical protein